MDTKDVAPAENLTSLVEAEGALGESRVYELGYHLLPTVSEEELPKVVSGIMDLLKGENAAFVGERFPSKITLAYPIATHVSGKRTPYTSAYFGWVAFEISTETLPRIKTSLDKNPAMLRFLVVGTDREAVQAAMSGAVAPLATVTPTGDIGKPKREAEAGGELSEAALEEALKNIEKEDAKTTE